MIDTKITCDRCGATVLENRSLMRIESGPVRDVLGLETADLCRECGDRFAAFLRAADAELDGPSRPQKTGLCL